MAQLPASGNKGTHPVWAEMPPMFVGSETSLRRPNGSSIDPNHLQINSLMCNSGFMDGDIGVMPSATPFESTLHSSTPDFVDNAYSNALSQQFSTSCDDAQSAYGANWPQSFHPQGVGSSASRPLVRFGSDSHFLASGYVAPPNQQEPDVIQNLEGLEWDPQSGSNTQPNTQPSSPTWTRKRKLAEFREYEPRPYRTPVANGHHNTSASFSEQDQPQKDDPSKRRRRSVVVEMEKEEEKGEEYDDDDEEEEEEVEVTLTQSQSTTKPLSKRRPPYRRRREPLSSSTSTSPSTHKKSSRAKPATGSKATLKQTQSSRPSTSTGRTPLTHDQKKANHTTSEQRRRDATGRAYAELYDLVPELEALGKMSTTKKLDRVVQKLMDVQGGNILLRERLAGGVL